MGFPTGRFVKPVSLYLPLAGGTLTGTLNLGAQIATNTFEMYRAFLREFVPWDFQDWQNGSNVVSGTGGVDVKVARMVRFSTGTTHASTAGLYVDLAAAIGQAVAESINWDKKLYLHIVVTPRSSDFDGLKICGKLTQQTTIGDLAAHGLGFETNGANVNLATYGTGGSQQLVSGSVNLVQNTPTSILIEHDPASADRLYVNGVLKATQSTAANIPSTAPAATYRPFLSIARSGGTSVADVLCDFRLFLYGVEI